MARIKKNLNAKAVKAIRKMITYVLAHPEELDQNSFPEGEHACYTPFCGAGHIVAAAQPKRYAELIKNEVTQGWSKIGKEALGLPLDSNHTRIFGAGLDWPLPFANAYERAEELKTLRGRRIAIAKVFAKRWEAFIESDAKDLVYPYYPSEIKEQNAHPLARLALRA